MFKKRFGMMMTLLLLVLLPTLAAAAGGADGQFGTEQLVRGRPYAPVAAAKPGAVQGIEKLVPPASSSQPALSNDVKSGSEAAGLETRGKILHEGFEKVWPAGLWRSFDNNGSSFGSYCWDDDDYRPYGSSYWSAWVANGCANGLDPQFFYYPHNMDSWMAWGPFNLSKKTGSSMEFQYWSKTEVGFDKFYWCASPNNVNYYCSSFSGNSKGWKLGKLDLKNVPGYGSMLGDSSVWIAFVFRSDGSVTMDGVFVDAVKVFTKP